MNYSETLQYLYSRLPMFQRIGAAAFKKDLGNTLALLEALGNPHHGFRSIHVAGTNGKGSVSSMLNSVFVAAGYKTGLYTSPHLREFTERIRINGEEIPQEAIVDFVAQHQGLIERVEPSFFEVTVAMAFEHFARERVDVAVIEVGMGGRLDSTNVITPEISVITNISMDHAQFLGDTLAFIAGEKAGIIKPGVPVVLGQDHPETRPVFEQKAQENEARIVFAGDLYTAERLTSGLYGQVFQLRDKEGREHQIEIDLAGHYQIENLVTVMATLHELRKAGWDISDEAIANGLANVKANSGLRGRMTVLQESPLTLADTGHNEAGVGWVLQQLYSLNCHRLHFVWGMVNDKDISKILALLPADAQYYFVKPDVPRGLDAAQLAEAAAGHGLQGQTWPSVAAGLEAAWKAAGAEDLVFVGGSTFVVAEVV